MVNIKLYNMDVRKALNQIPDNSVDCIITSPPYFGLRNYNLEPQIWGGDKNCEHEFEIVDKKDPMDRNGWGDHDSDGLHGNKIDYKQFKVGYCKKCNAWLGNLGLENTPNEFIEHLVEVFTECMRVLKPTGVFFLNIGDSYGSHRDSKSSSMNKVCKEKINSLIVKNSPNNQIKTNWYRNKQKLLIPHRLAIALQEKGFIIRDDIVWVKKLNIYPDRKSIGSTMPFPVKDKLLPSTEYIFQIVKNEKYYLYLEDVKTKIKQATIERARRPISSTYTNDVKGNPYVEHSGMNKANERWANLCVGADKDYNNWNVKGVKVEGANPTNALMFRRANQHSKKVVQEHFASYPYHLAEFFIKIGCPKEVCNKCGKPKEIVHTNKIKQHCIGYSSGNYHEVRNFKGDNTVFCGSETNSKPSCKCNEGFSGGIVLDPFSGSGTTLKCARELGFDSIGIELNPDYVRIIEKRLFNGNTPLTDTFEVIK